MSSIIAFSPLPAFIYLSEHIGSPRSTYYNYLCSPVSSTPMEPVYSHLLRIYISACYSTQRYQLPFLHLTRLYHFTLSHSGSHIPQPTLKPYITALAPRLRYQLLVRLYWVGIPPTLY